MKIKFRNEFDGDFLSKNYHVSDFDVSSLFALIDRIEQAPPEHKVLVTLDDIWQASYTSFHASESYNIDFGSWLNEDSVDPAWLDGNFLIDDLPFEAYFKVRSLGFANGLQKTKFEDIFGHYLQISKTRIEDLFSANRNLVSLMAPETILMKVPVKHHYESIYAFPNGYFSDDLNPFEVFLYAKHMEEHFGYQLFGIGAQYLGFRKSRTLSDQELNDLMAILDRLYVDEGKDYGFSAFMRAQIASSEYIILPYAE